MTTSQNNHWCEKEKKKTTQSNAGNKKWICCQTDQLALTSWKAFKLKTGHSIKKFGSIYTTISDDTLSLKASDSLKRKKTVDICSKDWKRSDHTRWFFYLCLNQHWRVIKKTKKTQAAVAYTPKWSLSVTHSGILFHQVASCKHHIPLSSLARLTLWPG